MPLPRRKKNMVVRVKASELDYGNGVTKREALKAFSSGYMQGVNKKRKTVYKNVQTVKFRSGSTIVNKNVRK